MNIILTGIPRSGTTLTCTLLNHCPQTVALHEPMAPSRLAGLPPAAIVEEIQGFFNCQRQSLLREGMAISKSRGGQIPSNPFMEEITPGALRQSIVGNGMVHFGKSLTTEFQLVIKQPNAFTALLDVLKSCFPCFAIIRNPLAVLLSWQSINAPVNRGHIPMAEAFDPELARRLGEEEDRISRQIMILDWYFCRYHDLLPGDHVIRYENIVESGGAALSLIDPDASRIRESLESRNCNRLYDATMAVPLARRLLSHKDHGYRNFYRDCDIEQLMWSWA
jgi:hypothetical protein